MQAHNTVTPGIGQRIAFQGSYRVPYAQISTSLTSWPTRIGVRAFWCMVASTKCMVMNQLATYEIAPRLSQRYSHLARTRHDI